MTTGASSAVIKIILAWVDVGGSTAEASLYNLPVQLHKSLIHVTTSKYYTHSVPQRSVNSSDQVFREISQLVCYLKSDDLRISCTGHAAISGAVFDS